MQNNNNLDLAVLELQKIWQNKILGLPIINWETAVNALNHNNFNVDKADLRKHTEQVNPGLYNEIESKSLYGR